MVDLKRVANIVVLYIYAGQSSTLLNNPMLISDICFIIKFASYGESLPTEDKWQTKWNWWTMLDEIINHDFVEKKMKNVAGTQATHTQTESISIWL